MDTKVKLKSVKSTFSGEETNTFVGGGAITAECSKQLIQFAQRLNLPVTSSLMGLGAYQVRINNS